MTRVTRWPEAPAEPAQFTEPPIVIGGCARSGTTLLLSILSCHPRIYAIPTETQLLCDGAFDRSPTCRGPRLDDLYELLADADQPDARRWCEKTPRNVLCFNAINTAIPDAKLVHLVRDGRDVCTSLHPGNPSDYWVPPARWMRETAAALSCPDAYTLRYEDLVRDYSYTIMRLLDWIGESWHANLTAYPAFAKITASRAWAHDAIPLHENEIGRWRRPEHADRLGTIYREPGIVERLVHFGYPV